VNSYDRIYSLLVEGKSTGGDLKATAERLGKWYKNINPKAKPGEKGYMRKRNVPKPGEKYDPDRHAPPKKGKPLEYDSSRPHTKPQHGIYARAHMSNVIGKMAAKDADKSRAKKGNIHKIEKEATKKYHAGDKKGKDILRKHGWRGPMERKK
jgi:hypothetical protein